MNKTGKRSQKKPSFFSPKKGNSNYKKKMYHEDKEYLGIPPHLQKELNQAHQKTVDWIAGHMVPDTPPMQKPAQEQITLDPWQKEAVDALVEGANVIVDAPQQREKHELLKTIFNASENVTFRACYTCPVKSLSNDKLLNLDRCLAPKMLELQRVILKKPVSTDCRSNTRNIRNSLLGVNQTGRSLVVFDEYHFLDDKEEEGREEAMILTYNAVLLSASISNGEEMTGLKASANEAHDLSKQLFDLFFGTSSL